MQVTGVQNYQYNTNFKSWVRTVYESPEFKSFTDTSIVHCNNTSLCREPMKYKGDDYWVRVINYFIEKYKDVPKVNIYSLGCSNGAEDLTIMAGLNSLLGKEEFTKFTPLHASDYDPVAINYAKSANMKIGYNEAKAFDNLTNRKFGEVFYMNSPSERKTKEDYFKTQSYFRDGLEIPIFTSEQLTFKIRPEITDCIEYKVANALEEYKTIERDNSIVNASNLWFYLGRENAEKLAQGLFDRLRFNSCIRVGDFDDSIGIKNLLCDTGFKMTAIPYVFEKPSMR